MQGLLGARVAREEDEVLLVAYDPATVDAETADPAARDGTGRSHSGRRSARLLAPCSMGTRRPLAYAKQPGNVPDAVSQENAARQLRAPADRKAVFVTDVGSASEANLGAIPHSGNHVPAKVVASREVVYDPSPHGGRAEHAFLSCSVLFGSPGRPD